MPDAIGNLFKAADKSDRVFGASGQLLRSKDEYGWTEYTYDAEGNLTQKTDPHGRTWQYDWNDAGFLQEVMRPDGKAVTFTYDALGRRVTKTYAGRTTCWVWDGDVMLHEWEQQEVPKRPVSLPPLEQEEPLTEAQLRHRAQRLVTSPSLAPPTATASEIITWVYEPDSHVPMAKLMGDQSYSIITDQIGAPIEVLDQSGASVWSSSRISGYGVLRDLEGGRDFCPFRFQGQYVDIETGLYYNRYRYFDPEAGQYISQDPIGLAGGNPTLYAYVSDQNTFIDPLGLSSCKKKTLKEWLKNEPELLDEARLRHTDTPEWQGIDPDETEVFYRPKSEVDEIRKLSGESGGHHPHGLALGGPKGQKLTPTGETRKKKNPLHSSETGFQRRLINKIKKQIKKDG